eukprot:Opistho-2@89131
MASRRVDVIRRHLAPSQPHVTASPVAGKTAGKSADDIVVCCAVRTPITKAKRGGLKDTLPDDLLAAVLAEAVKRTGLKPENIGDIVVGNVLLPGGGALVARLGQFLAGIPETVPLSTVNRQCSSGLQAFVNVAGAIRLGQYDIGIAAGVESMSNADMMATVPNPMNPKVGECDKARDCLVPMGITSENVAEKYNVTREQQDQFSANSHTKAKKAQDAGHFDAEIVSVHTITTDAEGNETPIVVSKDDGIRGVTTAKDLAKLRAAFKEGGTTTAGNSSQVSDGASAVVVARRSAAEKLGLPIIGSLCGYAVTGVPPEIMGVGPAYAIPNALKNAGLSIADIDVFEINEAFASQAIFCVKHLGIPEGKVNPNGGAIALGHPLGCTGNRQIATLLNELKRTNKRFGVVSMCIGTGMGAAAVFERE